MSEDMGFLINPDDLPEDHPLKQMIAAQERRHMEVHDFSNRWRRFIAEELTYEQLDLLRMVLTTIADNQEIHRIAAMANWYEGQLAGALAVRKIRLDEAPEEEVVK